MLFYIAFINMLFLHKIIILLIGFSMIVNIRNVNGAISAENCELSGGKCHYSPYQLSDVLLNKRPIVIDPMTGYPKELLDNAYNFDKDEKVSFLCLGNGNGFFSANYISEGYSKQMNYLQLICVCNSLYKHICTVFDLEVIQCNKRNHGDLNDIKDRDFNGKFFTEIRNNYKNMIIEGHQITMDFVDENHVYLYVYHIQDPNNLSSCFIFYTISWMRVSERGTLKEANTYPTYPSNMINPCQHNYFSEHYNEDKQLSSFEEQSIDPKNTISVKTDYVLVPTYLTPPDTQKNIYCILATDTDMNISPQWKIIQKGNWAKTEEYVKNNLARKFDLIIMSGVHDYLILKNNFGKDVRTVWLYHIDNVKETPIPLYFFKLVANTNYDKGQVFITINNPYLVQKDVNNLISNVCTRNAIWQTPLSRAPQWNNNFKSGYSFCCYTNDFFHVSGYIFNHHSLTSIRHVALDGTRNDNLPFYFVA